MYGMYGMVWYGMVWYVVWYMVWYAMLCYAMLCYAMLCYAMLCYVMLCYAMLCYPSTCSPPNAFGFVYFVIAMPFLLDLGGFTLTSLLREDRPHFLDVHLLLHGVTCVDQVVFKV